MFAFLKRLLGNKGEVAVVAHPIEVASTPDIRGERNELRKARLRDAISSETNVKVRAQLQAELDRRKQFGR